MRTGIEVGGTFTDLVAIDGGKLRVVKVPSTPVSPERGAHAALAELAVPYQQIDDLVHGSTVATNAILERKGARIALLVTAGTRDVLYLQRHNRRDIYDLHYRKPEPVVQRRDTFEVRERIGSDGQIVDPLDESHAREILTEFVAHSGYEAVAICLLNSYANSTHERTLRDILADLAPGLLVTCSTDVMPVFREYERCSTTALAAYVQPVISAYLQRFSDALDDNGFAGRFSVMQSNGGRLPAAAMSTNAITSLFSGPAAGVVGAARQGSRAGFSNLITFDMGGTSTDVCLVEDAQAQIVGETEVDGLPIKTPVLDIATVGAGGGSIVWVDDGGLLRVGPQSAGADPGPACYRRGGQQATITDAHIVRGTVRAETFLGGAMPIDRDLAMAAFADVAAELGLDVVGAADSAIQVAEANIVRAIQRISTERGKDPRDYALVAFGGAGPMQAVRVAEELGLQTVIVPRHAGVLSAYGLLASDFMHFESQTQRIPVSGASTGDRSAELVASIATLRNKVIAFFQGIGMAEAPRISYTLEMRYITQAFEIPVQIDEELANSGNAKAVAEAFRHAHHQVFEFDEGLDKPCEVVSLRVGGAVAPDELPEEEAATVDTTLNGEQAVFERGEWMQAQCLARGSQAEILGPAVIEDGTSTIFLPVGWRAAEHASGSLLLSAEKESKTS